MREKIKIFAQIAIWMTLSACGLFFMLYFWAVILRPELRKNPVVYSEKQIAEIEKLRDVSFDPDNVPIVYREVDYSEGRSAEWHPEGEPPILAELVKEGKLPPVEERVGEEPLVLEGVEGSGVYGGTWYRLENVEKGPGGQMDWRLSGTSLVRWSPLGYPIVPHVAKGWEVSTDFKEWTFFLRKGMKWSDGHPFTTDDIVYFWQDHCDVVYPGTKPEWQMIDGRRAVIEQIDSHTIKFVFHASNAFFLERLASAWQGYYAPRHYLKQYHPEAGNDALIEASMKSRNIPTRRQLYLSLTSNNYNGYYNVDHPRIWPWIYRTYRASAPQEFVRNPYYWAVDTEGNQLPYIDRIHFDVVNQQLVPLAASSGDVTMQARHLRFDQYTLLMSQRETRGYEIYHWFPSDRSVWTLWPNLNRVSETNNPASEMKGELLNEKTFRQALSLAIDRRQIIDAEYHGVGEPSQAAPGYESVFHHKDLMKSFVEYDPERANRLLDELGIAQRDSEGYRKFRDGTRMVWFMDYTELTGQGPAQFIVEDWARVGIRAIYRERASRLYHNEKQALKHDFTVMGSSTEFLPLMQARSFVPVNREAHFAIGFATWYLNGGLDGDDQATSNPGSIEPPLGHPLRRAMEAYEAALRAPTKEQQRDIFKEVLDIATDNVWSISISTSPPQLAVVKNGVRNVPRNAVSGYYYATPANAGLETYYIENENLKKDAGRRDQLKKAMLEPESMSSNGFAKNRDISAGGDRKLGKLIRSLVFGIICLILVLAGIFHPYIGRRLLFMIPTLMIISGIAFTIIQLPPGDFIDSRILALQMSGEEANLQEIEELREVFYLNEPMIERYARWLGLYWFASYESGDTGLLQGNLGRSMELNRPVNDIVGERIILTLFISLGTILLTWVIALPIGTYSAVKQYTTGDYFFTFLGFFGMCVPNFLLAIILMYLGSQYLGINPTGLYSPEYAAQPDWTWAKATDLLKHIWVPIVVLGIGGTATMMRVMRGNLLDELKKPYVTTARAKGVRPFKLLIKYPLRLALNPFVSSIGSLFPQLVSGGAIVALVMSLPTVGPLMLQALLAEDMYLAGSMLMVLSLLGVMGTLVSDLLLLWLDPRIRMDGDKR